MKNNHVSEKSSFNVIFLIIAALLLIAVLGFVYLNLTGKPDDNTTNSVGSEAIPDVESSREDFAPLEAVTTPDIPVQTREEETPELQAPEQVRAPLPPLTEADPFIRNYFQELGFSEQQILWLSSSELFQRWVTVVDGLSQGQLIRGVVSVEPPKTTFPMKKIDNRYFLDEKGFSRFDSYIAGLEIISPSALADTFHYFRPLLEKTYGQLGYPPENFDNTLILALDNILKAPVYPGPIELTSKSVAYLFEDPELEKLTPLEKFMIRMGPENTARIQTYVAKFKESLISGR